MEINSKGGWYDGLNARQSRFVEAYLIDFNAAGAARRAGYAHVSARQTAKRLLDMENVESALTKAKTDLVERNRSDQDRVLEEIQKVAYAKLGDCVDPETGECLPLHKMPEHTQAALASMKVHTTEINEEMKFSTSEPRLYDKLRALDMLARYHDLYNDTLKVKVDPEPTVDVAEMTDAELQQFMNEA